MPQRPRQCAREQANPMLVYRLPWGVSTSVRKRPLQSRDGAAVLAKEQPGMACVRFHSHTAVTVLERIADIFELLASPVRIRIPAQIAFGLQSKSASKNVGSRRPRRARGGPLVAAR